MATTGQYGSIKDKSKKAGDIEADSVFTNDDGSTSVATIRYGRIISTIAVIISLIGFSSLVARSRQNGEQFSFFEGDSKLIDDTSKSTAAQLTGIVGYGSFEGITTTSTFEEYDTGSAMGSWSINGTAFIANKKSGAIKYSTPTPNGLSYSCMLQCSSRSGQQPTTSIQKNFAGLIIGSCYSASFYNSLRFIPPFSRKPTTFTVNLGGNSVYSTVPSTTSWVQVTTSVISAVSTSMDLEFQISSRVGLDGDLGLDGVTLSNVDCPTATPTASPTMVPTATVTSMKPTSLPTPVPTASPDDDDDNDNFRDDDDDDHFHHDDDDDDDHYYHDDDDDDATPTMRPTATPTLFNPPKGSIGASFEGITSTTNYQSYTSGQMGVWTVFGQAYLAYKNNAPIKFGTPTPNGLSYSCMLETGYSIGPLSSIQTSFTNLNIGVQYCVSFSYALRSIPWQADKGVPATFNAFLGDTIVYSTVPSSINWLSVQSTGFTAISTSLVLKFQTTNAASDGAFSDMGIDAVFLASC